MITAATRALLCRLCAACCALLVFLLPSMAAESARQAALWDCPSQQAQLNEEEEHKTCVPARSLLESCESLGEDGDSPVRYDEQAVVAHHGDVAVPPPEADRA